MKNSRKQSGTDLSACVNEPKEICRFATFAALSKYFEFKAECL